MPVSMHLSDEPDSHGLADSYPILWSHLQEADNRDKDARPVSALHNEIDCRIAHGAEGGHLEFVRSSLAAMLDSQGE